eukprot:3040137-Rhodomonas_salina.2
MLRTFLLCAAAILFAAAPAVQGNYVSPITVRTVGETPMSGPIIGRDGFSQPGLLTRAWTALQVLNSDS